MKAGQNVIIPCHGDSVDALIERAKPHIAGCPRHPAWPGLSMVKRTIQRAETDQWIGFGTGGSPFEANSSRSTESLQGGDVNHESLPPAAYAPPELWHIGGGHHRQR